MIKKWKNISVSKKLYFVIGLMAFLIASELLTLIFAINTLSSVRAFVAGEGLWTKAQKNSIHNLYLYALEGNENYYQKYVDALEIPSGDYKARIELLKPNYKYDKVKANLILGGNHPDDIDGMIHLLLRFNSVSYIRDAIVAWENADLLLQKLQIYANQLHLIISKQGPTAPEIKSILLEISKINNELTNEEIEFSSKLGEGSRWLERVLTICLLLTIITIEGIGLLLTFAFNTRLTSALNNLQETTYSVANGNYNIQAKVDSKDELGQLAESINHMINDIRSNKEKRFKAESDLKHTNELLEVRVKNRTVEALRRESQLQLITNALSELVAQIDKQGTIYFANESFYKNLNFSYEDIIGKNITDVFPTNIMVKNIKYFEEVSSGKTITFQSLLINQSSENFNITLVPDMSSENVFLGYVLVAQKHPI